MKNQWLTIKQLDSQLKEWQVLRNKYGTPTIGWIKTLRTALSMSAEQFASRLGLTRARINQLENSEAHDAVTLRTLKAAANAIGCELIYAIVPKGSLTLEEIISKRAEQLAKETIEHVAHSMSLESQSVNSDMLQMQQNELATELLRHPNKKFWTTTAKNSSAPDVRNQLLKVLIKKDK